MSFFSRVSDIINANVSDMLDRAEDPEKMVKMLIFEMEEQIAVARDGVAKAIAGEKQLEANLQKNRGLAEQWRAKAGAAVGRDDDDLARKCLARKKEYDQIAASLQPQWEAARKTSDALKSDLRRIEEKLEEAVRRRDSLIARQMAAEASREVQGVAPSMNRVQRSFDKFDRMERKIEGMEAEAAAYAELSDLSTDLDRDVEQAQRDAEVELELAALKQQATVDGQPRSSD
ncbi:phage shock protein A [Rhodopirellula sp. SM50]|nr:PspA/IM30 family protein [Rhodopirellula sp. SM50]PAY16163.1 phage shock protein A [Rhodopirellula sp. SM50]